MPPVPLMAVVAKMASDCDSSPLYRQRPPSPQRLFEQDTIELDCVGRERSHHRVLLTVGGASVCCASSSRLHSHTAIVSEPEALVFGATWPPDCC